MIFCFFRGKGKNKCPLLPALYHNSLLKTLVRSKQNQCFTHHRPLFLALLMMLDMISWRNCFSPKQFGYLLAGRMVLNFSTYLRSSWISFLPDFKVSCNVGLCILVGSRRLKVRFLFCHEGCPLCFHLVVNGPKFLRFFG